MKKSILIILTVIANTYFLTGQNILWQKSYGGSEDDKAYAIQQTTDGGYIVVGYSYSTDGDVSGHYGGTYNSDCWVLKLTATGDTAWTKCYGGSYSDYAFAVQQTTDGGYIVAGASYSTNGDVSGNHGLEDYWVLKLTAVGDIEWSKTYGGSDDEEAYVIQQTTDGGYIVAGDSWSTDGDVSGHYGGTYNTDCWVLKLTATGDTVWTRCYGGSGYDYVSVVQQTTDGGYIVAGASYSTDGDVNGNHGGSDYWLLKLTATGDTIWTKCYGGSMADYAYAIQQTTDGGYIVAGASYSTDGDVSGNHGNFDYWVLKLTATGDTVWTKCYGGSNEDWVKTVQQTSDGGYIVVGGSVSTDGDVSGNHGNIDCWLLKLTATGDTVWARCYGGSDDDKTIAIQQTTDGGYVAAGYSKSTDGDVTGNHGGWDYWIVKLDNSITGIPLQSVEQVAVYPNPAHNQLLITATTNQAVVTLYDTKGQQVLQKNLLQKNATIDISTLAKGSYVLKLSENNKIKVGKFVKK